MQDVAARPVEPVPLPEVSGLAVGHDGQGGTIVAAVGDRAARIAWTRWGDGGRRPHWRTVGLDSVTGTRLPRTDPQIEAIAIDGAGRMLLVQESPCRAEYIDPVRRRVLAHVSLDIPAGAGSEALRRSWQEPEGSHAEGVVLLADGHLLVVKEKQPTALLEFGPAGEPPAGFGPGRWLAAGQSWRRSDTGDRAAEVTLALLAAWEPAPPMHELCPDLSDAAVGPHGDLLLLSDQGSCIAVVPAHRPAPDAFAGQLEATAAVRLAGVAKNPEGIVLLPTLDVLVACDRREPRDNLFVVPSTSWQPR